MISTMLSLYTAGGRGFYPYASVSCSHLGGNNVYVHCARTLELHLLLSILATLGNTVYRIVALSLLAGYPYTSRA